MSGSNKHDVFFYEAFTEEAEMLRRFLPPGVRAAFTGQTIQESGHAEAPARLISIRTQSIVPRAWQSDLSGILARATGYDGLLRFRAETNAKTQLGYLPAYCARAVAEQAMMMWMALLRKLPLQMERWKTFHRDGLTGRECERKRLLVVGVGHIGVEIVVIGQGLAMEVRGVDIKRRHPSVSYVSKEEGIAWADVIVCAMNLTNDNVGYFNHESLSRTRPSTVFVNVARGEISPPHDLLRLIDANHLGGVALDVFDKESDLAVALRTGTSGVAGDRDAGSVHATLELARRPNVLLTPHNAFNTVESVERKAKQSIEQVEQFLKAGTFVWPVPV